MTCSDTPGCCCEIHTLHAELIHAQAEIQQSVIEFTAADWQGEDYLEVVQSGPKGPNQIGPHFLPKSRLYDVTVYRHVGDVSRIVNTSVSVDRGSGIIVLRKTRRVPAFSGRVEVR